MTCRDMLVSTLDSKPWLLGVAGPLGSRNYPKYVYHIGHGEHKVWATIHAQKLKPTPEDLLTRGMAEFWKEAVEEAILAERAEATLKLIDEADVMFKEMSRHQQMAWWSTFMSMTAEDVETITAEFIEAENAKGKGAG